MIASHKDLRPTYRCNQCAFTTNKLYNLKAHQKRHGYKEFKCSDCDYETHERCKLVNHIQKHHSTGPARYQEGVIFFLTIIVYEKLSSHDQISISTHPSVSCVNSKAMNVIYLILIKKSFILARSHTNARNAQNLF